MSTHKNEDYKIIKELNKGDNGIVYLIEKYDKIYVLKRQKLLPKEVKLNYKYSIWREIDFNKFVNKLPNSKQKYFMIMYDYQINKCDYQHKPKYVNPSNKEDLISRNKSKYCLDMVLEYKGNIIYDLFKKGLSIKEKYCFIIQVLYALDIMRSNGYLHSDIHQGNIIYQKINYPIKIYGKTLPCEYQYSLIDYGFVRHIKYDKTKKSENFTNELLKENWDVLYHINHNIILQSNMLYESCVDKKISLPKITRVETMYLFYKDTNIWNKIKKILYADNEEWFNLYESKQEIKNWDLFNNIFTLFSALNRKKFLEYSGWNIYIPNLIHSDDIIFMVKNITDNKKMIKYFLNKLSKL